MLPALLVGAAAILLTLTLLVHLKAPMSESDNGVAAAVFILTAINIPAAGFMVVSAFQGAALAERAIERAEAIADEAPEAVAPAYSE